MFLYTKYFLVFMSISMLSPIYAMNIPLPWKEDWSNICSRKKPISILSEELPPPDGSALIPVSESSLGNSEEQGQRKVSNELSEKEQLQNIKNLLIEEGLDADPNLFTIGFLKTPVICAAAENNDVELVEFLLKHGANINASDRLGNTALTRSINIGNNLLCEYLLQKGADPNSPSCIMPPLENAIFNKNASIIKSLIKYSANIDGATANKFVGNSYVKEDAYTFNLKKEYYLYIKTVLLVLNRYNNLVPGIKDLRFLILSYLPEYHCHPGLYKELLDKNYVLDPFALHVIDGHTKLVQEILHIKNKDNKNILELFPSITKLNEKLLSDAAELKQKYSTTPAIQQGNLAFEALEVYASIPEYKSLIPKNILLALACKKVGDNIYNTFSSCAADEIIVRLDVDGDEWRW